ncbi:MAG: hypothetical protein LBU65_17265 [Planctomycetaceae bacterium]|jgi:hypothetical protein|nr:hypothetical protein [Planctomycetaceae bacterium]
MRLSLRTLLAFEDNIFDADYRRELQRRIPNQEDAARSLQRIRNCLHAPQLGVPGVGDGGGEELDPNYVAEYLDHQLTSIEVDKFEAACLRSDVYLAEVASCHQILTNVLGEPARASRHCRSRCYRIAEMKAETENVIPFRQPNAPIPPLTPSYQSYEPVDKLSLTTSTTITPTDSSVINNQQITHQTTSQPQNNPPLATAASIDNREKNVADYLRNSRRTTRKNVMFFTLLALLFVAGYVSKSYFGNKHHQQAEIVQQPIIDDAMVFDESQYAEQTEPLERFTPTVAEQQTMSEQESASNITDYVFEDAVANTVSSKPSNKPPIPSASEPLENFSPFAAANVPRAEQPSPLVESPFINATPQKPVTVPSPSEPPVSEATRIDTKIAQTTPPLPPLPPQLPNEPSTGKDVNIIVHNENAPRQLPESPAEPDSVVALQQPNFANGKPQPRQVAANPLRFAPVSMYVTDNGSNQQQEESEPPRLAARSFTTVPLTNGNVPETNHNENNTLPPEVPLTHVVPQPATIQPTETQPIPNDELIKVEPPKPEQSSHQFEPTGFLRFKPTEPSENKIVRTSFDTSNDDVDNDRAVVTADEPASVPTDTPTAGTLSLVQPPTAIQPIPTTTLPSTALPISQASSQTTLTEAVTTGQTASSTSNKRTPIVLGKTVAASEPYLLFNALNADSAWEPIRYEKPIHAGQYLLTASPFRAVVELNGGMQIELVGDSKLLLLSPNSKGMYGIHVDYGRVIIRLPQASKPQSLYVQTERGRGVVTLAAGESTVFIDTFAEIVTRGSDDSQTMTDDPSSGLPEKKTSTRTVVGIVPQDDAHVVHWQQGTDSVPIVKPTTILLEQGFYDRATLQQLPKWLNVKEKRNDVINIGNTVLKLFEQDGNAVTTETALTKMIHHEDADVRALGYRLWGDLGRFKIPIRLLQEEVTDDDNEQEAVKTESIRRMLTTYFKEVKRRDSETVARFNDELRDSK